jgi:DNA-binding CsgD family transcriptional regulator
MYLSDPAAGPASIRAVELAEACGDAGALEAALTARHLTCAGPSGMEERAELAERMLALGKVGTASTQLRGLLWGIGAAFEHGDLAAVARDLAPLAWCADQVGGPLARWQLLRTRAALAQAQARFADVTQLSEELAEPSGLPLEAGTRLGLASAVGHHIGHDVAGSAALLVPTTSDRTPAHAPGVLDSIGAAYVLAATGRHAEAAARYRELGPPERWRPRPHVELVCHALAIDVAIVLGRREDVAVLRGMLDRHRGRYVVARAGAVPVFTLGPVELWLGRAAAHLGCLDDAVADLEAAAASAGLHGAAGFVVEAGCELAAALARRDRPGDTARARALATATATDAGILGMTRFATQAATLRDRLDATAASPLTHREREVATLVADRLTNREIAQRLQLSERTAQNHVQHILTKLDLRGRREIAAWLAQRAE